MEEQQRRKQRTKKRRNEWWGGKTVIKDGQLKMKGKVLHVNANESLHLSITESEGRNFVTEWRQENRHGSKSDSGPFFIGGGESADAVTCSGSRSTWWCPSHLEQRKLCSQKELGHDLAHSVTSFCTLGRNFTPATSHYRWLDLLSSTSWISYLFYHLTSVHGRPLCCSTHCGSYSHLSKTLIPV